MSEMNVETRILLDKFKVRWYQKEVWQDVMNAINGEKGPRRFLLVGPRRMGKDLLGFMLAVRRALKSRCYVQYFFSTYGQAKKVIWQGITNDGIGLLDLIPHEIIYSKNESELRIIFQNGSIIQFLGAKNFSKSGVGVNPAMIIFSEFAKYDSDEIFIYSSPILAAQGGGGGICLILSTPMGKNFMWALMNIAKGLPNWKIWHYKTSELKHIPEEALWEERKLLSEEMYNQEYECDFNTGVEGTLYGRVLQRAKNNGQICPLFPQPELLVHTVMDIGVSKDSGHTAILFFQVIGDGSLIRIIDCYSSMDVGLPTYIKIIKEKGYTLGRHFMPADGAVREFGSDARSRISMASSLGLDFELLPQERRVMDGIENCLVMFPRIWIDEIKCKTLIDALENYRRIWNEERQIYDGIVKNWTNHYADAFRYMCRAVPLVTTSKTAEDWNRARNQALYGAASGLPNIMNPRFQINGY